MSWFYKPYVPVARRKAKGLKIVTAMKKKGEAVEPVQAATARGKIATSFWGQAWCEHLESYSDFTNRLPRGRTYLRNGSVLHLGIEPGRVNALVMGSELYKLSVRIAPLPAGKWTALKKRCQGKIGSLVELLQGKISGEIMAVVTDRDHGLFPSPREIKLGCDCPDWADLCKHLAAILYGIGARLDTAPELLFKLRGVDHNELIQADAAALADTGRASNGRRTLAPSALTDVFGIELDDEEPVQPAPPRQNGTKKPPAKKAPSRKVPARASSKRTRKIPARRPAPTGGTKRKSGGRPARRIAGTKTKTAPFNPTAAAIRRHRENLGLSRSGFAALLGVSSPTVANWESKSGRLKFQSRTLAELRKLMHGG